jgi:hypothetical protein
MEKKYKLKEEVKEHLSPHCTYRDFQMNKDDWYNEWDYNETALEEVEEMIILNRYHGNYTLLQKSNEKEWTEKEIELIEFVVNNFESVDDLDKLTSIWQSTRNNYISFTDWLKQRKH